MNNIGADQAVWMHSLISTLLLTHTEDRFSQVEAVLAKHIFIVLLLQFLHPCVY